jgi:hypothetical protein
MSESDKISELRKELAKLTGDWEPDGCVPPNFVRKDGLGRELARVDRWCGGFQDVQHPTTIGWIANVNNTSKSGVVLVKYPDKALGTLSGIVMRDKVEVFDAHKACKQAIESAICEAKIYANDALELLRKDPLGKVRR